MGLNMPARTVVFTASRKWDGTDFRWISPGEYIQMSGRAGRRGLDDRGIVIQMIDEKMEPDAAKNILNGSADPLNSAFHLGYNMLLNLMRVEDADPEKMMALSFHQFQNERSVPEMQAELARLEEEARSVHVVDEAAVADYYLLCAAIEQTREAMRVVVTRPEHLLPFLQPGRLIRVSETNGEDWGWGVLVNFQKRSAAGGTLGLTDDAEATAGDGGGAGNSGDGAGGRAQFVADVLLACAAEGGSIEGRREDDSFKARRGVRPRPAPTVQQQQQQLLAGASSSSSSSSSSSISPPAASSTKLSAGAAAAAASSLVPPPSSEYKIVPVLLGAMSAVSSIRVYLPKDLRPRDARDAMGERVREVVRRFPAGLPLLDPVEDMQINSPDFSALVAKSLALQTRIAASTVQTAPDRDERFAAYREKVRVGVRLSLSE